MKMFNQMKSLVVLSLLGLSVLAGCRKEKDEPDSDTSTAIDNSFAEATYNDVSAMADQAAGNGTLTTFKGTNDETIMLSPCATVTHDSISSPRVITIDFGTTNCLCLDGRYRRGQIIVTYQGAYRDSGSVHTIRFNNYFVNDYQVGGTKTVTNEGTNSSGNTWFSIAVAGSITATTGQVLSWSSAREREWIEGASTAIWSDDVYRITGQASGTGFSGTTFTAVIDSPLLIALDCKWIKEGVISFTPSNRQTRVINYGYLNGNCDRLAQVTIGSNTYTIELR